MGDLVIGTVGHLVRTNVAGGYTEPVQVVAHDGDVPQRVLCPLGQCDLPIIHGGTFTDPPEITAAEPLNLPTTDWFAHYAKRSEQ